MKKDKRNTTKNIKNIIVVSALMGVGLFLRGSDKAYADTTTYSITYYENTVANMPDNESGLGTSTDTTTLSSTKPRRDGFRFGGWCNTTTTKDTNGYDTCSGTTYLAGANNYPINNGTSFNTTLYAIWQEILPQSSCPSSPMLSTVASGITYMQDINSGNSASVLSALTTGNTYQIKDNRDNETYCVGKLADGKLWLLDNLALDLLDSDVQAKMYSSTDNNHDTMTNASNATLKYLFAGGGTTSNKYATSKVIAWPSSSYSYSVPWIQMDYVDSPTTGDTYVSGVDTTSWKYGGYYNYCAASAGSYCYGNGTSAGTSSGNATEDICPKGWRMPTGNTSGEYSALANEIYGSTGSTSDATAYANYRSALRLPLSGYFDNGSANSQGSFGYWWSSTRNGNNGMYRLYANTSGIGPAGNRGRDYGGSVRCVLGS